jgi:hypothetical protein
MRKRLTIPLWKLLAFLLVVNNIPILQCNGRKEKSGKELETDILYRN